MVVALGDRQHFGDVVDVGQQARACCERLKARPVVLFGRPVHIQQAYPQKLVNLLLEGVSALTAATFERNCHVIVERECGAHASKHSTIDALMLDLPLDDRLAVMVGRRAGSAGQVAAL
jgi:hypothetical protein